MTVAVQIAFADALVDAATAHGVADGQVHEEVAPSTAAVPYVVYTEIPGRPPRLRVYGGSRVDESIFQVACVAATRLEAKSLRDLIVEELDGHTIAETIQVLKDRDVPLPSPEPDQVRFVSAVYFRVTYLGGQ